MAAASPVLGSPALPAGPPHAMLAALLIVLSFAATMAAPSPVTGMLRLIRSFIHRRPVLIDLLKTWARTELAPEPSIHFGGFFSHGTQSAASGSRHLAMVF